MNERTFAAVATLVLAACGTSRPALPPGEYLHGRNYTFAAYDDEERLIHSPIEHLETSMATHFADGRPISDVYVVVHGWDYTLDESVRLYEDYRKTISTALEPLRAHDPTFEPYFVFVTWNSVTRPIAEATRSLMPWNLAEPVRDLAGLVDQVVFHVPSAWGESQKALRIALGDAARWSIFDPHRYPKPGEPSEYEARLAEQTEPDLPAKFPGYDVPLSVLLDQMIRMKRGAPKPFALHVVGHSFGGKIASNATFDAIARVVAAEAIARPADEPAPTEPLVDSLVLLLPAMRPVEMYKKLELKVDDTELGKLASVRDSDATSGLGSIFGLGKFLGLGKPYVGFRAVSSRVGRKVVVNSRHDSANGWIFALSETLISHNSVAEAQEQLFSYEHASDAYARAGPWGKVGWFAPALVEGAGAFVAKSVMVAGATLANDVSGLLWDGPASQITRGLHEEHWYQSLRDFAELPLSPFLVHRSVGHTGLVEVKPRVSYLDPRGTWLDHDTAKWLAGSPQLTAEQFERASAAPRRPVPNLVADRFLACDASDVYDGHVTNLGHLLGGFTNLFDGGAHGDIRSFDEVPLADDPSTKVFKRARTFYFVYNVTRWSSVEDGAATR